MIKNFIESIIGLIKFTKLNKKKKEYVFYSESKFYRDYYIDLIISLKKINQNNIVLVTSDRDDLKKFKDEIECIYISNYYVLTYFFKILDCKFMIMTLTDLGNHLQKSKLCKYYVYFFHAMGSTHQLYTNQAFKNYDIVLANGEYQSKELKLAEQKFNFSKKEIVNSGYIFLDNLKKKANLNLKESRHILFAPSWNYNKENLFDDYGIDIISILLSKNFKITLRPHPEHYKRSVNTIHKIEKLFLNNHNFILDKNFTNLESLEKSEILITDNSSIVLEYVFIFKRPIIYVDYKEKVHNIDRDKINLPTIEEEFKLIFGNIINVNNINNLSQLCNKLLIKSNISNQMVELFAKKYLSNLGSSASFAANYLTKKSKFD
ncbi:CDP-glycerol glycerophosphotransferase family protein [Candidatus Pelagibacter sp.]|nr:CDP-glycerol glycerophosphotransferase family protein [Candidatus Pelagibacter sp.]|tara:strand:- start:2441 stop:3568 length:1128 start_codon:yes stop_codon:yes gene_type:complete